MIDVLLTVVSAPVANQSNRTPKYTHKCTYVI